MVTDCEHVSSAVHDMVVAPSGAGGAALIEGTSGAAWRRLPRVRWISRWQWAAGSTRPRLGGEGAARLPGEAHGWSPWPTVTSQNVGELPK